MYRFSKRSLGNLAGCDERLQRIAHAAIQRVDFTVIEGARPVDRQKELVAKGLSKTMNSKHCLTPSKAFDFIPSPFSGWDDFARFRAVAAVLLEVAAELGIKARWGGDWDGDGDSRDERFLDGPHFELME